MASIPDNLLQQKYEHHKKELLSIISRLEKIADKNNFFAELSRIRANLQSEKFRLVILGQFKRGKTTFINAFLGSEVLPTDVIPVTAVITEIQFKESAGARIHFFHKKPLDAPLSQLHSFISESENPKNRKNIDKVDVFHFAPILAEGLTLVDTPGVGSIHEHNSRLTREYIPRADAAVFLLSADPPITETEQSFLKSIAPYVPQIFFILNKKDYLTEDNLKKVIRFNQNVLSALFSHHVDIYPVSALQGLNARLANDQSKFKESGMHDFEKILQEFLVQNKGKYFITANADRILRLSNEWKTIIEMDRKAKNMTVEQLANNLNKFDQYMVKINRNTDRITFLLQGIRTRLFEFYDKKAEQFISEKSQEIFQKAVQFLSDHKSDDKNRILQSVKELVNHLIVDSFEPFRLSIEKTMREGYERDIQDLNQEVLQIVQDIYNFSGSLFHIKEIARVSKNVWKYESGFSYKTNEDATSLESMEKLLFLSLPRLFFNARLKKQLKMRIHEKLDRQCGRLRGDFHYRINDNNNDFLYKFKGNLARIHSEITTLMQKNMQLKEKGEQELQEIRERQNSILSEIEKVVNDTENIKAFWNDEAYL